MAKGPEKSKDGEPQATGYLTMAAQKVVPLLVSAVVSVGFVAFAGKAVLWTRFEALEVPGDQVVKAVPQSEAVATGASMLLIFGLFGLLAALTVFLVDRAGRATPGMSRGLLAILAIEAVATVWLTDGKPLGARIFASEVVLLGVGAIFWATFAFGLIALDREVPDFIGDEKEQDPDPGPFYHRDKEGEAWTNGISTAGWVLTVVAALGVGLLGYLLTRHFGGGGELARVIALAAAIGALLGAILRHCWRYFRGEAAEAKEKERTEREELEEREAARVRTLGEEMAREARRKEEEREAQGRARAERARSERRKPRGFTLEPAGVLFTVAFAALAVAVPPFVLHEWWLAVALGAVAVLGVGLWRVAYFAKKHVVWYALVVFISVPLFGTVMMMARNIDEPQVQPLAMIRNTDGPDEAIQGLYVTETDDRVYFANVATEGCGKKVTPNSGRLLWVPKSEVVAMSLGPLQSVKEASATALEMSYDLTPGIETGAATIDLTEAAKTAPVEANGEAGVAGKEEAAEEKGGRGKNGKGKGGDGKVGGEKGKAASLDTRLEDVGPAVRPNFGTGLRIEPETVSPGAEATLWLSRENPGSEGFGPARAGRNLRLGGKVVDIAKEPAGTAERAEYIELENHRLIALAKEEPYVEEEGEDGEVEYVLEREADEPNGGDVFVRLEDPAVLKVEGRDGSEEPYVRVSEGLEGERVASHAQRVSLVGGRFEGHLWESEEHVPLKDSRLLRQAWHTDHIRFHVPDEARSGVVTVECNQLAGAPPLQVSHAPTARLDVWVSANSPKVFFDSTRSSDEDEGEEIKLRWKIDGVREGHRGRIHSWMPPRKALHTIELTVTDRAGNSDTATLLMLRLPTPGFGVGAEDKRTKRLISADRKAIAKAVEAERPKEIELDGYTDAPRPAARNLRRALAEDAKVRRNLLPEPEEVPAGERAIPVAKLAHGESCRIDPGAGRRPANRHVDLFVLNEDVIVKPAEGCHAKSQQSAKWHPPSTSKPLASISSSPDATVPPTP